MRFRYVYTGVFSFLAILMLVAMNPDHGFIQQLPFAAGAVATVVQLFKVALYISLFHISRKGLFDYLDLEEYFVAAKGGNMAAAIALVAMSVFCLSIAGIIIAFA